MKLATKLVSIFMVLILLVIAADGWISIREETSRYRRAEQRQMMSIATALRTTIVAQTATNAQAAAFVEEMSGSTPHLRYRWFWFDDPARGAGPRARITPRDLETADDGVLFPIEVRREQLRLAYVHIPIEGGDVGGLEVEVDAEAMDELRTMSTIRSLRVAGLLILLSAISGVFFGNRLIAVPLHRLIEKTRRIGQGDLTGPVTIRSRDELRELAAALNLMCDDLAQSRERAADEQTRRIQTVEQLRHADRLRTVGQLAAGVAHELGTPLNVVSGRAGMITGGGLGEAELVESARIIKTQSERMATTVRQLLDFARPQTPHRTAVDLGPLVDRTVQLLAPVARKAGVELRRDTTDTPVRADVDAGQVEQIVTNLLVNAIQAMTDGGTATVRLHPASPGDPRGPFVRLEVEDTGPGIAPDVLERVFDPFFTTKDVGTGTGMGLAVAHGIAREHGGDLTVTSEPGRGASFTVLLRGAAT